MRKADNLPPSCAVFTKSGSRNFLEPSGPVQACNGSALLLPTYRNNRVFVYYVILIVNTAMCPTLRVL